MTVSRGLALLLLFVTLGVMRVHLRNEQTRLSMQIQSSRAEELELRREAWALELEIARLSAPEQIRERADRWRLDVRAPWPMDPGAVEGNRLAGH